MIRKKYENLDTFALDNQENYIKAEPFPHIVIDDLFEEETLDKIISEFPNNLDVKGENYNNRAEKKVTLNDLEQLSITTNNFINYLNSSTFLEFLQKLTNIKETLISDPYLIGGGLHELKNDGFLNIHSDFNRHPKMKLDRRLNILIYLNKNWKEEFGGQLQLWDKEMIECKKSIVPIFNRTVIFSTTDYSYHGNPLKINHPENISRKSIALYYYSNGRPKSENLLGDHSTIFRKRPKTSDIDGNVYFKKIFGKLYYRKKNKIK
jgi:Rps23 Pro-64 3,4-dihydroxylase Tpa1-like proline 4-hydroxylase